MPVHLARQNKIIIDYLVYGTSLVAQTVKSLSTMLETWFRSLGQEDPLEKEKATHSSTLAWKIPGTANNKTFIVVVS